MSAIAFFINNMEREDFTKYDVKPKYMTAYIKYNGPHFNKELCDFAVSKMTKEVNGEEKKIKPYTKEDVDNILQDSKVELKNTDTLYDYVFVANMCKADFLGSSITSERHLALYVKDIIDDVDAYDGVVFTRWYADMCRKGIPVDWRSMI